MPIPNNPLVAKVSMVGNRDTRQWVNTFHVAKTNGVPWNAGDLLTIATAFKAQWDGFWKPICGTIVDLDVIQVRKLDPSDPLALDYTTGLPSAGTLGTALEAANVTLALSWRTGLAGRKFRGRFYFPSIADNQTTQDDRALSALVAAFNALLDNLWNAPVAAGPYELVVFHLVDSTFTAITSWVVDAILDSQRRRLPGRGR